MSVVVFHLSRFRIDFGAWVRTEPLTPRGSFCRSLASCLRQRVFSIIRSGCWVCESYEFVGSLSFADHVPVEFQLRQ